MRQRQREEKTKKRKISIFTKIILCLKIVSFDNKKSINSGFKLPSFSPFRVAPITVGDLAEPGTGVSLVWMRGHMSSTVSRIPVLVSTKLCLSLSGLGRQMAPLLIALALPQWYVPVPSCPRASLAGSLARASRNNPVTS